MSLYPHLPDNAPFSENQRSWLGGFFSGLNSRIIETEPTTKDETGTQSSSRLAILYGTQTGNAEALAEEVSDLAYDKGIPSTVFSMDELSPESFATHERVLLITSTYGDGEMPDNAQALWDSFASTSAPKLDHLHFSVLGLGDTSYDLFCQAAIDWDRRIEELGGTRILDRVDCDLDYEAPFAIWSNNVLDAIIQLNGNKNAPSIPEKSKPKKTKSKWTKQTPYPATLLRNSILTKNASSKETRHYEISLANSGMEYNVGDALAIIPSNCSELVMEIIERLKLKADTKILLSDNPNSSLFSALKDDFEIKLPSKEFVKSIAERSKDRRLTQLLLPENKSEMSQFMWGRDLIDFLIDYPQTKFTAEEFITLLKPLQPRLYSISSSQAKHPDEVHLTVASVRYKSLNRARNGVCSTFLADRITADTKIKCYLVPNKNFGLPEDDSLPIIMVGPGTGIAPFRAFLEERDVRNASGKNWLFFGERNRDRDFLYENELHSWLKSGLLNRLDLAFSRDQENKIYVQDLMTKNGLELYTWLEEGAYFYVCGDAQHMAKDVETSLLNIIKNHGAYSDTQAQDYLNKLKSSKRYVRDVY
tara:strand:- start:2714 stop:4483 length:1770 start_codon:yes stop_codon:yes gene_type:complete